MTSPRDPHTKEYSHINGSKDELSHRFAVSELCKGWPQYRDASEWKNFRALFCKEAWVWTTWSGPRTIDDFIQISKDGKAAGVFIMHREIGTLVELNASATRAVGKMKATITQRFALDGVEFDVDCDARFVFFCVREETEGGGGGGGAWRVKYTKLFYDKDKVVPVDGRSAPAFSSQELGRYPAGYQYLGAAQARLGYAIDLVLPTPRNGLWWRLYGAMEDWLDGKEIDLFWEKEGEGAKAKL